MSRTLLTLIAIVLCNFSLIAGDPDLFYFVADGNDNLYSVDRSTSTVTNIGATGVSNIEAIAYYPIPGANQLFAANGGEFGELNVSTGAYTAISDIDAAGQMNGALGLQSVTDVDAMMLDGQTFIIWAAQRNSPNDLLFQINPSTGQVIRSAFGSGVDYIVVSGPGINVDVDDLGVDPTTGRMYASNNDGGSSDNLIEINKFNATYSVIAALGEDDIEGLAFHNDGTLYGSEGDIDRMSEINLTTGATTNQITLAGGDVEALASLVADANTISGTVYSDTDLDGVLDGGEMGVSGVILYLYIDNNTDGLIDPEDTRIQTTTSDVNGDYTFYYASTGNLLVSSEFSSYPANSALTTDNIETATFTDNVNFAETDANNNFGIGTGADCDGDGLPNFFEGATNSDIDPVLDSCDLDSDNDGILDSVEGIEDFDDDGIPNYLDRDSDDDGIPDAIEANRGAEPTGYTSGVGNIVGTDSDGNGIVDAIETAAGSGVMVAPLPDSDNDGNPDYLDLDSDNDGILDIIEAGGEDSDLDGQVDGLIDANSNGLDDRIESTPLTIPNTDLSFETTNGLTNLPNYIDIDSDSDGIDDTREGYSTADYDFPTLLTDTDSDGIIDFWDVSTFSTPITPYDRDSDDTPDYLDSDSDNDGVSDLIEGNDANADGVVDVALSGVDADDNGLDDALDDNCGERTVYSVASDYGEEDNSDGSVDTGSSDLELVNDGSSNQTVGIQFSNVDLDQGQTITSAFVQFEVDEITSDPITITIHGELSTNAAAFTTSANDVTGRTTTSASLSWTPDNWTTVNENGTDQKTVDISSIIQEIVNQGGWANGNSLVLIFSGPTGNTRTAETDPLLIVSTPFDPTPTLDFIAGDYAEEDNSDGSIDLGSSDLELPNDGGTNQTVGIFFPGITLDQGQIVTSAYLQFEADEVRTGSITLSIEGELSTTAATFTSTTNDVSSRPTTTATAVSWSPTDWNTIGEASTPQQSSDITTLVQEIVNQSSWANGNNMAFIITGPSGNRRTAETDPTLVLQTTATFSICASSVAHQDFDNDGEDDFRDTDDDADGIPTASEIPDADGSGTPDYLEFDGDECGIGFIRTGYNDDYTGVQDSESGVANAGNFTGSPDGSVTTFNSDGDEYIIDFEQIYPAGYRYVITWREAASQSGTATIVIAESDDDVIYSGRQANQTTNSTTLISDTVTSQFDFQYIRFQLLNSASSTDFEIDAVGVLVPVCDVDSDDDGIVDSDDIDDDNDGVLDIDEGCPTYTATVTSSSGVTNPSNITGSPDGSFAGWYANGNIMVYDFGSIQSAGTQYAITWREEATESGTASLIIEESTDNSSYTTHSDAPTTNSTTAILDIVTSENSFRYIRISKNNPPSSTDFEIDAIALLSCTDTDGDGVPNNLDLDSDNDGIPDIQEAGGTDTDSDGRVDNPTDTDGDGWANTFDSDNGGTALTDGDKDGDGLENRIDLDADNDGIADIIEAGGVDANNDGVADTSTDTDGDGFSNTFDNDNGGTPLPVEDEDGDGIQNYLDLDSDSDGIIDNVEGQTTAAFLAPLGTDTDGDGWDNRYDSDNGGTAITLSNNEGFGNPDYLDDDTDGDGLLDWIEGFDDNNSEDALDDLISRASTFETAAGNPLFYVNADDGDGDGIPDWLEDDDGDNVPNFLDPDHGDFHDTDADGIVDLYDTDNFGVASILPNGDGDAEPDFRDTDDQISLPISLIEFKAYKSGSVVILEWSTSSEVNNEFFTIERLNENNVFVPILTHPGAGNSNRREDYQMVDQNPKIGYNYYRLRQTDYDGKSDVFNVEVVKFDSYSKEIMIFPNPTDGSQLNIDLSELEEDNYELSIYSTAMKLMNRSNYSLNKESGSVYNILSDFDLDKGTYFLIIQSRERRYQSVFIVN